MAAIPRITLASLLLLALLSATLAQTNQTSAVAVTATASIQRVRYVSLGEVHQTRLQIFSPDGSAVFDSGFRLGNLIDWELADQTGARLIDGAYLFLVTAKDFSDRVIQKFGTATIEEKQVYLEQTNRAELSPAQTTALESNRQSEALSPIDRIGAAGLNQPVNAAPTKSNSSTAEKPLSRINGTSSIATDVAGTGLQNNLAKWLDNSGTLGNSSVVDNGSGKIGIGTSTPSTNLDVQANSVGSGGFFVGNINNNSSSFPELGLYNDLGVGSRAQFYMRSSTYTGTDAANSLNIYTNAVAPINIGTNGAPRLRIDASGNVGIGTTNPATNLEVKTNVPGAGGFFVGNVSNNASAFSEFGLYNNLGPSFRAQFYMRSSTYTGIDGANSFNIYTNSAAPINIGTSGVPRVRIDPSGMVGIGTTNPQSKLDVSGAVSVSGDISITGNASVSGNIAAKYQDMAEWVASRQSISPGMVVIVDKMQSNSVIRSYHAYDTNVAGVVTSQPGVILGERGPGKILVATAGRVSVKVNANKNPVRLGDLLVSSNRPGVAMRSRPIRIGGKMIHRPGTIIGKALEPLPKGEANILVLMTLQ